MDTRINKSIHVLVALCLSVACGIELSVSAAVAQVPAALPPSVITDQSRNPLLNNDFIRTIMVPHGVRVINLGVGQKRVFFGASTFFRPPIPVAQLVKFHGGTYDDTDERDFVALRCRPPDKKLVSPLLATWPNLLGPKGTIATDLADQMFECPAFPPNANAAQQTFCLAAGYQDTPNPKIPVAIASAIDVGRDIFNIPPDPGGLDGPAVLSTLYGIGLGFSGLGFAVKGSGGNIPLKAVQALRQSVVPEYLLRARDDRDLDISLSQAGCHCIAVPAYPGRGAAPLGMGFIWDNGVLRRDGSCRPIGRLPAP